jgi:hypothetical protein
MRFILFALLFLPTLVLSQNEKFDMNSECIRRGIDTIQSFRTKQLGPDGCCDFYHPNTGSPDIAYIGIISNNVYGVLYFDCVVHIDSLKDVDEALDLMFNIDSLKRNNASGLAPSTLHRNHTNHFGIKSTKIDTNFDNIVIIDTGRIRHPRRYQYNRPQPNGYSHNVGSYYGYMDAPKDKPINAFSFGYDIQKYHSQNTVRITDDINSNISNIRYGNTKLTKILGQKKSGIYAFYNKVICTSLDKSGQYIEDKNAYEVYITDIRKNIVFNLTFDSSWDLIPKYTIIKNHKTKWTN